MLEAMLQRLIFSSTGPYTASIPKATKDVDLSKSTQ